MSFLSVRRREEKYYVNQYQYALLSSLFKSILMLDSHSGAKGHYLVRSVYFDSLNKKDFFEKEMGIKVRRKIRLRFYDDDYQRIKLEKKEKINKHSLKESLIISNDQAKAFSKGQFDLLKTYANDFSLGLYDYLSVNHYRLSAIVDYEREAYVHESFDLRVNFDKHIRGITHQKDIFLKDPNMVPIIDPELYILEVKYTGHLPDMIKEILACVDLTKVSYSKYYYALWSEC
ncbi:polyphosphate polymerase domain-containing protein [Acidaminobacter sp. JC074]|uniref:polyphosphate polymerase domain-containing protein n=1 Tax=Acidaminobacter sp. JC074 TaxID=2530199 RepID=UPI001F0DCBB4|nr:polyphosphate polymerase domain-containing protein [Acidaminobacter sp. JC074]MCH4889706.1 polyphosphate polymerase domain-containing protein [Acidaminobacter sp. JC074]